uniref:Uncharacterized protein n=1 Tax=Anguilla anguilla TaxID=7936 RepID=A0A0E9PFR8_ANGAN
MYVIVCSISYGVFSSN